MYQTIFFNSRLIFRRVMLSKRGIRLELIYHIIVLETVVVSLEHGIALPGVCTNAWIATLVLNNANLAPASVLSTPTMVVVRCGSCWPWWSSSCSSSSSYHWPSTSRTRIDSPQQHQACTLVWLAKFTFVSLSPSLLSCGQDSPRCTL